MDDMNVGELLVKEAKENATRAILEILNESKSLEEAKEKVKALLNKYASSIEKSMMLIIIIISLANLKWYFVCF